jgi:hypothetical protein
MTWYLRNRETENVEPLEANLPSGLQQAGAAFKAAWIKTDAWFQKERKQREVLAEMEQKLFGDEGFTPRDWAERMAYGDIRTRPDVLLSRAEQIARMAPEEWGSLPLNRAQFDGEVNSRRQAELDEAEDILSRGDSPWAQLGGSMAGYITDQDSLPLLFLGGTLGKGAAGLARFIAAESAAGAVGEVPAVIKERQVAGELGFEPGSAGQQIATGALLGGAFGAVIGGGIRALDYLAVRTRAEAEARDPGTMGIDHETATAEAEIALREGRDPPAPVAGAWDTVPNGEAIRNGIFVGESGGDYDALFSYSNRAGGPFQNVKLTEMTVDEAIAFSAPGSAYMEWVKGQIGRPATPMGAYQIVGTTLRAAKQGLGLRGDEVMTPELQDKLGVWIYRQQGTGAWEGYAGPRDSFEPPPADAGFQGYVPGAYQDRGRRSTLPDEVVTPAGRRVRVEYEVVDMARLRPATGDLQPRDRARAASDDQITKIAANLDAARLMPAVESDSGAPIIGPDDVIESGNGRVMALGRAAETNPDAYRGYVEAIREAGFDVPEGMERPVLVARRTSQLSDPDRVAFVRESNTSSIARMSATEQARFDAGFLDEATFDAFQPGQRIGAPANAEFVRRLFGRMTAEERGALFDAKGRLNADGLRRIRGALFARAFDADDLIALAVESESRAVQNLIRMLEDLAPQWAAFRAMVDAGMIRPEFDVTPQLMDAVRIIAEARAADRDGQSVIGAIRDRLAQGDMFAAPDPMVEALIDVFYKGDRARSPDASGEILERYAAGAAASGRADMADMTDPVAPVDLLSRAIAGQEGATPYASLPPRAVPEPDPTPVDVSALDPAPFTDGTDSPVIAAANDVLEDDLRAEVGLPPVASPAVAEAAQELPAAPANPPPARVTQPASAWQQDMRRLAREATGGAKTARARAAARAAVLRAYFAPGNIVRAYGGKFDRVLGFDIDTAGQITVRVQGVVSEGDGWVPDPRRPEERSHSTAPAEQDLQRGPVARPDAPAVEGAATALPADDFGAADIAAARAAAAPDLTITLGKGTENEVTRTAADILADLDAERGLDEVLDACRIGRNAT